ncbi:hypothetical protein [Algibacter lectus]|nr:hypothetical protein [Algibacter lectus]
MEKNDAYNGITTEILETLRTKLFIDFDWRNSLTDSRKLELQLAYISLLQASTLQEKNYVHIGLGHTYGIYSTYIKSVFAGELLILNAEIRDLKTKINNKIVLGHLNLCLKKIPLN